MLDPEHFAALPVERLRPLHRSEYDRLVELGVFGDERLELLYGMLVAMSPQGAAHAFAIEQLYALLRDGLKGRAVVRSQSPLAAPDESEPEPDVAVLPPGRYIDQHPDRALFVIEVADSSLKQDRRLKARLYAAMKVPEYWIVNLVDSRFEIHTEIVDGRYTKVTTHGQEESVSPHAFPDLQIRIEEVLPRR
jgi:Uma2 family endonuclease